MHFAMTFSALWILTSSTALDNGSITNQFKLNDESWKLKNKAGELHPYSASKRYLTLKWEKYV